MSLQERAQLMYNHRRRKDTEIKSLMCSFKNVCVCWAEQGFPVLALLQAFAAVSGAALLFQADSTLSGWGRWSLLWLEVLNTGGRVSAHFHTLQTQRLCSPFHTHYISIWGFRHWFKLLHFSVVLKVPGGSQQVKSCQSSRLSLSCDF